MALDYTANVVASANQAGVDPNLALAVMRAESSGSANAVSSVGAVGLFQLMPSSFPGVNINDPVTNIDTGIAYLAKLLNQYNGDTTLALAAYNAGPGNVAKYGGVPPFAETQNYVANVLGQLGTSTDMTSNPVSDTIQTVSDSLGVDPTTLAIVGGLGIVGLVFLVK